MATRSKKPVGASVSQSFVHDTTGCFAAAVGAEGLDPSDLAPDYAKAALALERLRAWRRNNTLALLRLPERGDDLTAIAPHVRRHRENFAHVVVLGTGGSSLGGRTLCALADSGFGPAPPPGRKKSASPKLHFLDNIDPVTFERFFAAFDPAKTGFVAISKSGGTAETLAQCFTAMAWVEAGVGRRKLSRHFTILTEPASRGAENPLRRLAAERGFAVLDHDPNIGGRFSALSIVGLLPAAIAGLDCLAVRNGAAQVLDAALRAKLPEDCAPAVGAAINIAFARKGLDQTVLMPYADRLASFGLWFRQLWAESLGKNGHGTTPIAALGTVDQHSQLQLYLAGPPDKLFTLIFVDGNPGGRRLPAALARDPALAYLAGRTMGELLAAEREATAATLMRNGRPVRILRFERLDETALGALMMHFMLETIIAADLLGVNAFDQPAVEEGKILARAALRQAPVHAPVGEPSPRRKTKPGSRPAKAKRGGR